MAERFIAPPLLAESSALHTSRSVDTSASRRHSRGRDIKVMMGEAEAET